MFPFRFPQGEFQRGVYTWEKYSFVFFGGGGGKPSICCGVRNLLNFLDYYFILKNFLGNKIDFGGIFWGNSKKKRGAGGGGANSHQTFYPGEGKNFFFFFFLRPYYILGPFFLRF